ncbi:ATP-binding protein [Iodobacter sp. CM08]|uniref:response regulator n=1 Tax=Iodobacter sp. CM08 TaxID=3085902 RepID=UPI002981DF36|nr:response regulator [Iodobacter sp. CM08]MDW5419228.1 ATP-binding protein [Iodobacter sp. CM08]
MQTQVKNFSEYQEVSADFQQILAEVAALHLRALESGKQSKRDADASYKSICNLSSDAMLLINVEGKIVWANHALVMLFAYPKTKLLGLNLDALVVADQREKLLTLLDSFNLMSDSDALSDASLFDWQTFTGSSFSGEMRLSLLPNQGIEGANVCLLVKNNSAVQSEAKENNKIKQILDETVKVRRDFLANISHEIRTPMNAIIGMTHLVFKTELNIRQKNYIEVIQRSSEHLLSIVNDIFDFSKMEEGQLVLECAVFDLNEILKTIEKKCEDEAKIKNIALNFILPSSLPEALVGDAARLQKILLHLVGNAIKFTQQGRVELKTDIQSESELDITIKFSISDTGLGIDDEQKARLFQAFSQADTSATRKFGGLGMGLVIAKKLVKLMGGEIGVISELGKGSCFWCCVPLKKNMQSMAPITPVENTQRAELMARAGSHILLVEDNALNQQVASEILIDAGMQVTVVSDGQQALDIIEKQTFDLILMDIQMPVLDGWSTAKIIRGGQHQSSIPIVALTALSMNEDRQMCMDIGMSDHLLKPIDSDLLMNILIKWLPHTKRAAVKEVAKKIAVPNDLAAAGLPRDIAGLDMVMGLKYAMGNPDFYRRLLIKVLDEIPKVQASLAEALLTDHWSEAKRHAHTLKGIAATIGADIVQKYSAELELALGQTVVKPQILKMQIEVSDALHYLLESLQHFYFEEKTTEELPTVAASLITPLDEEGRKALFEGLQHLLQEGDAAACEFFEENQLGFECLWQGRSHELARFINQFAFNDALEWMMNSPI